MTYENVLKQIENAHRFGKEPGRLVTEKMLEKLDHPDRGLNYIHIAGTNGKGSVCAFLEKMAMDAGLRTGKFTSPHLIRFNERITVDGEMISDADVARLGEKLLETDFGTEPTMFDYCLAMALLYFKEQACDLVILETGLGGRLDSTRALCEKPLVSVITRIGFDHMAILGNSLAAIAGEKAGIIRPGVPVVSGPQEREAIDAISREFLQVNGQGDDRNTPLRIICRSEVQAYQNLPMKMQGAYQKENAAIAFAAMNFALDKLGRIPDVKGLKLSIAQAFWPGRMEILSDKPFLMVDGAHNSNGVQALSRSLSALFPGEKFHFVMGVMADKDYMDMIGALLPLAMDFVTVTPESSRALQGSELAGLIEAKGLPARYEEDWLSLLQNHLHSRTKEKWICFGSLYFIGEVKEKLKVL